MSGVLSRAVLAGLFFSALLCSQVNAQESGGGTLVEEKTWALISVSLGGAVDVKQEVRQGWKYNGTVFSARAQGGLSLGGSVGGTPNVSYFDYDTRILVRKDSKVLLDQPAKVSKDGGSQSFSLSVDPSPGTVEIELTITGGNPEFFTRYVKGTVTIEAPPTPPPPPTAEPAAEPTAEAEPTPEAEATPPPLRASVDISPSSLAADGQSLATVTATCTDAQGRPATGASVTWQIGPRLAASEQGSLEAAEAVDGSGRAKATYSAPLLEAAGFQQIGEAKSRTIAVECAYRGQTTSASAGVSLLKTALVELVVEKPGVETYRQPIRIGSLNGSIKGRLMLQARNTSGATGTTDRPLNDATVRLAGTVLGPAAIDDAASADNGDFTIRLRMNEWKPWNASFGKPIVLRPSSDFKAREARVLQHLGEWGGGADVHERTRAFVWGSESLLANLPSRETPGLASKLQITGWMLLVLKSGEDEGRQGIGEFLGHTLELVKAVASYCFEESKLQKWMDDRFKGLQKSSGFYALRVRYAKWLKAQGTLGSLRTRVWQWLSVRVTGGSSTASETQGAGHLQRMAIDKVIVAKIVEILSDGATEMVQSQTEGITGAITDRITNAILDIYRKAGDEDLLLFLDNRNYARIEAVSVSVEASLSARKGRLDRERFTVEQRRIAHDAVATLFGTISEFGQAVLRVTGVGTGQAELIFLAGNLEKLHEKIATATELVRFGEEAWNLARIYSRAEQVVLEAVAETAGVASASSASLAPRPTNRFDLLPVVHADEGDTFDLAAGLDPLLFTLDEGKAKPELALTLSVLEEAMAGWRSELQPKLPRDAVGE